MLWVSGLVGLLAPEPEPEPEPGPQPGPEPEPEASVTLSPWDDWATYLGGLLESTALGISPSVLEAVRPWQPLVSTSFV